MEIWRRFYPVSLRWLSPEEGGKRNLQNMGEHYYPVFLLDQDVKRESWWSVDVIVANRECDNWHATELSLVFCDSEASLKVQEKFAPGITFQLYEGPTLVAVGKVLARAMPYGICEVGCLGSSILECPADLCRARAGRSAPDLCRALGPQHGILYATDSRRT